MGSMLKKLLSVFVSFALVCGLAPAAFADQTDGPSVGGQATVVKDGDEAATSVFVKTVSKDIVAGFAGYNESNSKMSAKVSELTAGNPSIGKGADELLEVASDYAVLAYASGGSGADITFTWTIREKVAENAKSITLRPATSSGYFLSLPAYDKNTNKRTYSALNLSKLVSDVNAGRLASVPTGLKFEADKHYEIACTATDGTNSTDISPITLSTMNLVYEAGTINSESARGTNVTVTSHDGKTDDAAAKTGVYFEGILKNSSVSSSKITSGTVYNTVSSSIDDPKTEKIASVWGAKVKSGLEGEVALKGRPKVSIPVPADTAAENASVKVVRVESDGTVDPNHTVTTTVKKNASTNKLYVEVEALTVEGKPYIGEYGVIYTASGDKYTVAAPAVVTKNAKGDVITDKVGGTLSASIDKAEDGILCGNALTYTLFPKAGYYVESITTNTSTGVTRGANFVTFDPESAQNYTLTVTFREAQKTDDEVDITATVNGGNGKVSINGDTNASATPPLLKAQKGSTIRVHFIPDEGYGIDTVTVNGVEAEPLGAYYTFTAKEDTAIIVKYKKDAYIPPVTAEYEVTVKDDMEGFKSATQNPENPIEAGGVQDVTITPKTGYELDSIKDVAADDETIVYGEVTGIASTSAYTYTVANIAENHLVIPAFKACAYDATVTVTGEGTVTSSVMETAATKDAPGTAKMNYKRNATFSLTPAYGYKIGTVTWNNGTSTSTKTPTGGSVTVEGTNSTSQALNVSFVKTEVPDPDDVATSYSVTCNVEGETAGGQISPAMTTILKGASQRFDFVANEGYVLTGYTVTMEGSSKNGNFSANVDDAVTNATYLLENACGNVTVTATFADDNDTSTDPKPDEPVLDMVALTSDITGSGTIDNMPRTLVKGSPADVVMRERDGWKLEKISIGSGADIAASELTRAADGVYVYDIASVDADTVVHATFVRDEEEPPAPPVADAYYTLTIVTTGEGALLPQNTSYPVASGASTDIPFKSDADHALKSVTIRWADNTTANLTPDPAGFVRVPEMTQDATVMFTFGAPSSSGDDPVEATKWYTIDAVATTAGGTISEPGRKDVPEHSNVTYTFVPASGFEVASVKVDGALDDTAKDARFRTFTDVSANHTIEVAFAPIGSASPDYDFVPVTVFVTGAEYGSVSPLTAQVRKTSGTQTFELRPAAHSKMVSLTVRPLSGTGEGVTVKPTRIEDSGYTYYTYTVSGITDATNLYATFASEDDPRDEVEPVNPTEPPVKATHTVKVASFGPGSVSPLDEAIVEEGNSQTFTFMPNTAAKVKSVSLDSKEIKLDGSDPRITTDGSIMRLTLAWSDVEKASELEVTFESAMYTIVPKVEGGHGTISPDKVLEQAYGTPRQFTLRADDGYVIDSFKVGYDGAAPVAVTGLAANQKVITYTVIVTADIEAVVKFKEDTTNTGEDPAVEHKLIDFSVEVVGPGTVEPDGKQIQRKIAQTFTPTADKNFQIAKIELKEGSTYTEILPGQYATGSYTVPDDKVVEGNGIRVTFDKTPDVKPPYEPGKDDGKDPIEPTDPSKLPEKIGSGGGDIVVPPSTPAISLTPEKDIADPDAAVGFWISDYHKKTWTKLTENAYPGVSVEKESGKYFVHVKPGALRDLRSDGADYYVRVVGANRYIDIPVEIIDGPGPDEPGYGDDPADPTDPDPNEQEIGEGGGVIEPDPDMPPFEYPKDTRPTEKDGWYISPDGGETWDKLPSAKYPGVTVDENGKIHVEPGSLPPTGHEPDYIFRQVSDGKYKDTEVDVIEGPGPDEPGYKGDDKSPVPNPGKNIGTNGGEVPPATPDVPYDNGKANDKNDKTSGWFISKELGASGSWVKLPDASYAGVTFDNTGKVTIAPGSLKDVRDDGPDYILRQVGTSAGKVTYKDTPIYITPEPGQGGTPTGDGTPTDKVIGESGGTIPPEDEIKPFNGEGKNGWFITDDLGSTWTKLPNNASYPAISVKSDGTLDIPSGALTDKRPETEGPDYIVRQVKGDKYHDTEINVTTGPGSDDPGYGAEPGDGSGEPQNPPIGSGGGTVDPGDDIDKIDPNPTDPDKEQGWWISPDGGRTWDKLPDTTKYPGVTPGVDSNGKPVLNIEPGALDPMHEPPYIIRVVGEDGNQQFTYKDIPMIPPEKENPGAGTPVVGPDKDKEITEGESTSTKPDDELLVTNPDKVDVWITGDGGKTWTNAGKIENTTPRPEVNLENMAEGEYEVRFVVKDGNDKPISREEVKVTVAKGDDSKLPKPDASVASDLVDVDVTVSTTVTVQAQASSSGSITLTSDPSGYVSPSGQFTVTRGSSQDFYVFPNDGKYVDAVVATVKDAAGKVIKTETPKVDGFTGNVNPMSAFVNLFATSYYDVYTFRLDNMTDAQYDIYVSFKDMPAGATRTACNADFYTLTDADSVGGTVTPGSTVVVPEGTQINVSMYPHASDTTLDDYTVYGKSRKGDASFQRVNGELYKHTFTAEKDNAVKGASVTPYAIFTFAQLGRSAIAASSILAAAQQNQIPVAVKYSKKTTIQDPTPVPLPGTGSDVKAKTYKLTAKVEGGHGKITSKKSYTVTEGSNAKYTFKFQPDTGFAVATVKLDDKDPAPYSATEYTFNGKDVKSDHTIVVTFAAIGTNSDPGIAGTAQRAINKLQYLASTGDLTPPAILMLLAVACGALGAAILANGRRRKKSE